VVAYWRQRRGAGTGQTARRSMQRQLGAAAHGVHVRSGRSEAASAWELHEGHTRWCFVRTPASGAELDRNGARGWPRCRRARANAWRLLG
jgi:hypothetical protein